MSYLLDTSVISQFIKDRPEPASISWLRDRTLGELHISVATMVELREGIELMPEGKRRSKMERWFHEDVSGGFDRRILPMTLEIADRAGRIAAAAHKSGHHAEALDVIIASTAVVHGLVLVTLNRKHFQRLGVELVAL